MAAKETQRECARRPELVARAVEGWFAGNCRDLPWRKKRSGYTGLVSESMLQQTQVSRVVDIYQRFMKRFPTVRALAAADEQDVLAHWQGLGYYRRARHLHAAARMVVEECGGRVPHDAVSLQQLPGVGRYSAGAIASIVFGERAPIVDGNVKRVLARVYGEAAASESWYWERATECVEASEDPGAFNEGLMEFGATVCTPRGPGCVACPLRDACAGAASGDPESFPASTKPAKRTTTHHHCVVIRRGDRLLLERRPESGLWSGMWQPPSVEAAAKLEVSAIEAELEVSVVALDLVESFRHLTSHREVWFHVHTATTRQRRGEWTSIEALGARAMSNAHKRVLRVAGVIE